MVRFLQPVDLAEHCLLFEVLYWLAFRRPPLLQVDLDGLDIRFSSETDINEPIADVLRSRITEAECEFAGIPPDPTYDKKYKGIGDPEDYIDIDLSRLPETFKETRRSELVQLREEAIAFKKEHSEWEEALQAYLGYFKSRIWTDLREGRLQVFAYRGEGDDQEDTIVDLSDSEFKPVDANIFGACQINWDNSEIDCKAASFQWAFCETKQMLSLYPVPSIDTADKVSRLGEFYALEHADGPDLPIGSRRGRPALPWDRFHLELAARLLAGDLPDKKEAAIQFFEDWFKKELGITASRSSIGQKLTPYYERFKNANLKK